jgi:hypothetical protein
VSDDDGPHGEDEGRLLAEAFAAGYRQALAEAREVLEVDRRSRVRLVRLIRWLLQRDS